MIHLSEPQLQMLEQFLHVVNAWGSFTQALDKWAVHVTQVLTPSMEAIHKYLWQQYRQAGMPFGDSEQGMWAWARRITETGPLELEGKAQRIQANLAFYDQLRQCILERQKLPPLPPEQELPPDTPEEASSSSPA